MASSCIADKFQTVVFFIIYLSPDSLFHFKYNTRGISSTLKEISSQTDQYLVDLSSEAAALPAGAGGGCLDIFFSRLSFLFSCSRSLGDGLI